MQSEPLISYPLERMEPDYYEVLGVLDDASRDEVKAHYRLAVRAHHPDAAPPEAKEAAHAKIQVIIAAWAILGDPASRLAYDERRRRALSEHRSEPSPAADPSASVLGNRGVRTHSSERKKGRVQAVMGGTSQPRSANPRTKLLAMVFDAAQLYHVEGRPDDAARICREVLRADPTNAEAAVLLADIYTAQNQRAAALDLLERALRLQPANALYRSKWEALRHASGDSPGPSKPPSQPARASGTNPWSKAAPASPLASRVASKASQNSQQPSNTQPKADPSVPETQPQPAEETRQPEATEPSAADAVDTISDSTLPIPASLLQKLRARLSL